MAVGKELETGVKGGGPTGPPGRQPGQYPIGWWVAARTAPYWVVGGGTACPRLSCGGQPRYTIGQKEFEGGDGGE